MDAWFDWVAEWEPAWRAFAARALTDGTVAFAVVSLVWLTLRRWLSPSVGHLLFALVLLKLANPFEFAGPTWLAWPAWRSKPPRWEGSPPSCGRSPRGSTTSRVR